MVDRSSPDIEQALRLLAAEDARQAKLHELLETIREQIRLEVAPEHRPEGLFQNIQDAVYAMRGRTPLMNDAAITAPLRARSSAGIEDALRSAFPHFQDEAPITPEAIAEIGRDWSSMVMNWMPVPKEIKFSDQDGVERKLVWEAFENDAGWVIPDDADWSVGVAQCAWKPIDAAPKDGTEIILYEDFEPIICKGYWSTDGDEWRHNRGGFWKQPTHWMPKPAAPTLSSTDRQNMVASDPSPEKIDPKPEPLL